MNKTDPETWKHGTDGKMAEGKRKGGGRSTK